MNRTIEAIYRNGVLRPLQPLDLPEELRVILDIHIADTRLPGDSLAAWQAVYAGLSIDDVSVVEQIARTENPSHFRRIPDLPVESWRTRE